MYDKRMVWEMGNLKKDNHVEHKDVPYIVYEGAQARSERSIKRLIVAIVVSVVVIFASNLMWLYAWMQYDYSDYSNSQDYSQDGEGLNIIGSGNGVDYGATTEKEESCENTQDK